MNKIEKTLEERRAELKRKLPEGGNISLIKDKEKDGDCIQLPTTIYC